MYQTTKKLLSLILALILVCSCLNISIAATELSTSTSTEKEEKEEKEEYEAVLPDGVESYEFTSASSQQSNNNSSAILAVTDTIADGVYCFASSLAYRWMTIENGDHQAGKHVQHTYSTTFPTQTFSKAMLFKISQVGTTGRYIIRSMINNNLSFGISGSEVITKTIPNDDNDVSAADTFYIEASGNGYFIIPYGSSYVINLVSASSANLGVVAKTSATDNAKWTMAKYTGTHQSGMTLYRPYSWGDTGNIVGTTSQATIVSWSTYINANKLNVTAASGYEDLATVTWNDSTKTFTITAKNPGTMRVSAKIVYGGTDTSVYNGYFTHIIVPQQGTYYIQNAGTEKYIDVEGPSTSSGAIIQQWQFHTGNSEKWTVEHVSGSGGYVRLKSTLSNLYLAVASANTSSIKQYSFQNDYSLWKIERTSTGNQMLICKATESSGLVLSVPLSSDINGTDLTQLSYTDNTNYRDEWILYKDTTYLGTYISAHWNSTSNYVGYWSSPPTIYKEKMANYSNFYFDAGYSSAISQWESALVISLEESTTSAADIKLYGLTPEDYEEETTIEWEESYLGLTEITPSAVGYVLCGNDIKYIQRQVSATVWIIHNPSNPSNEAQTKEVIVHEIGHALGYFGHSSVSSHVMYYSAHTNFTLSQAEITHLKQAYDFMN